MQTGLERLRAPAPTRPVDLSELRVVEFADGQKSEEIAGKVGIEGVVEGDFRSERRLYGAMMSRAARAGAKVVVVDAAFSSESVHDGAIGAAIEECRAKGTRLVFGCSTWPTPVGEVPRLAPVILQRVDGSPGAVLQGGFATLEFAERGNLGFAGVVEQRDGEPSLHVAVLGFAAARKPACAVQGRLDVSGQRLILDYWTLDPNRGKMPQPGSDRITLLSVQPVGTLKMETGAAREDLAGVIPIPELNVESTPLAVRSLGWGLTSPAAELGEWVKGKVLVIGDARVARGDIHFASGRMVSGPRLLAGAIQQLLDRAAGGAGGAVVVDPNVGFALTAACTGLGVLCVLVRKKRLVVVPVLLVGATLVVAGVAAGVYVIYGVLANPIVPVAGLWLGAAAGVWIASAALRLPRREGGSFLVSGRSRNAGWR